MAISSRTRKMLWGRAANRCAICRRDLAMDQTDIDDESIIGDECHIVARESDGPRGQSDLTSEERDKYNNLVLMCKIHHKQIDDQPGQFTVEHLHHLKTEHEQWVRSALDIDMDKQRDDEVFLSYIDKWSELGGVDEWVAWTSWVLGSGQPSISKERDPQLKVLSEYLFSRLYPQRYSELIQAMENFRRVLSDFIRVFHSHSEEAYDQYTTSKFYRSVRGGEEQRKRVEWEYDFHVDLVQDLLLELTRAGNYVCDMVRKHIMPTYRMAEGLLIVESGPHMDMTFHRYRTEYRGDDRATLYPGLETFKQIRTTRDNRFGAGRDIDDPLFIERQRSQGGF